MHFINGRDLVTVATPTAAGGGLFRECHA